MTELTASFPCYFTLTVPRIDHNGLIGFHLLKHKYTYCFHRDRIELFTFAESNNAHRI